MDREFQSEACERNHHRVRNCEPTLFLFSHALRIPGAVVTTCLMSGLLVKRCELAIRGCALPSPSCLTQKQQISKKIKPPRTVRRRMSHVLLQLCRKWKDVLEETAASTSSKQHRALSALEADGS